MDSIKSIRETKKVQCSYCRNLITEGKECPYCREVLTSGVTELEKQIERLSLERKLLQKERENLEKSYREFKRHNTRFKDYYIREFENSEEEDYISNMTKERKTRQYRFIMNSLKKILDSVLLPDEAYKEILQFKKTFYFDEEILNDILIGSILDIKFGPNSLSKEKMEQLKREN